MTRFDHVRSRSQTSPSQTVHKTGSRMSASEKEWGRLGETFGQGSQGWLSFLVPIRVRIDSYSFHNTAAELGVPVQNTGRPTCASASQRA